MSGVGVEPLPAPPSLISANSARDTGCPTDEVLQCMLGTRYRAVGRAASGLWMMQWTLSRAVRRMALWRPDWLTSEGLLSFRVVMTMRLPLTASPMSNSVVGNVDHVLFLKLVTYFHDHF